jgi:hypothetical protein
MVLWSFYEVVPYIEYVLKHRILQPKYEKYDSLFKTDLKLQTKLDSTDKK